jgi:hypothetical protein
VLFAAVSIAFWMQSVASVLPLLAVVQLAPKLDEVTLSQLGLDGSMNAVSSDAEVALTLTVNGWPSGEFVAPDCVAATQKAYVLPVVSVWPLATVTVGLLPAPTLNRLLLTPFVPVQFIALVLVAKLPVKLPELSLAERVPIVDPALWFPVNEQLVPLHPDPVSVTPAILGDPLGLNAARVANHVPDPPPVAVLVYEADDDPIWYSANWLVPEPNAAVWPATQAPAELFIVE